jgi:glycine/D-amino acid oxidase-like deaminating enzyme
MSVIRAFRARFPALKELPVAHAWAGWCGFTLNFMPVVGRAPGNPACFHAVGYNGHGVAQAATMGGMMADLMLGKANPWLDLVCRKPAFMLPKPLRYPAIKTMLAVVNGIDRRIDRKTAEARG